MGEEAQNQEQEELVPAKILAEEDQVSVVMEGAEAEEETPIPPKRNRVRDMRKRIKDQKGENRELQETVNVLQSEINELKAGKQPAQVAAPVSKPTLAGCEYDVQQYEEELDKYNEAQFTARMDKHMGQRDQSVAREQAASTAEEQITGHYGRASELMVPDYEQAEDAAISVLGSQLVQSIQATIENSEQLLYFLGKNPAKLTEVKQMFDASPGRATFDLGVLSTKLSLKPKGSKAPHPEVPVSGGGGAGASPQFNKFLQRLTDAYDSGEDQIAKAREIRKEAAAQGIELPYNITE